MCKAIPKGLGTCTFYMVCAVLLRPFNNKGLRPKCTIGDAPQVHPRVGGWVGWLGLGLAKPQILPIA